MTKPAAFLSSIFSPSYSGFLILGASILTLFDTFNLVETTAIATVLASLFVVIEFPRTSLKQRWISGVLVTVGFGFYGVALFNGSEVTLIDVLSEHIKLAMILAAVNFIRLVSTIESAPEKTGIRSFVTTFGGMHVFSAIANFSAVFMVGEQLHRTKKLDSLSHIILARAFSLAVLWSPFLSILAIVLEIVPGSTIYDTYRVSIPLALFGIAFTIFEAKYLRSEELSIYAGYPLKRSTLILPACLITAVLFMAWQFPELPTVGVVTAFALVTPFTLLCLRSNLSNTLATTITHIQTRLPETRGEIGLFMSAGVIAAGVKACIGVDLFSLPVETTSATVASLALITIFFFASIGIHQFAVVAVLAGLFSDITTTPTMMAIAYIMGTSLSMSGSIFSALGFILQTKFGCPTSSIIQRNWLYSAAMIAATIIVFFAMEYFGLR